MLDFDKPIETRRGLKVTIVKRDATPAEVEALSGHVPSTDAIVMQNLVALVEHAGGSVGCYSYGPDGSYYEDHGGEEVRSDYDLVNASGVVTGYYKVGLDEAGVPTSFSGVMWSKPLVGESLMLTTRDGVLTAAEVV